MFSSIFSNIKKFYKHNHCALYVSQRHFRSITFGRYLDPKSDYGFQRLFRDELVLKTFITDFLNKNIKDVKFLHTQIKEEIKLSMSVDVQCETEEGETFIVAIQKYNNRYQSNHDFLNKTQINVANILFESFVSHSHALFSSMSNGNTLHIDKSGKIQPLYSELNPVHLIAIMSPEERIQPYKFFDDEVPFKRYKLLNEALLEGGINEDIGQKEFPSPLSSFTILELNKVVLENIKNINIKEWAECLKNIHLMEHEPKGLTQEGVKRAYSVLDKKNLTLVESFEIENKEFEAEIVIMDLMLEVIKDEKIKTIKKDITTYEMLVKNSFTQEEIKKTLSLSQEEIEIFEKSKSEGANSIVEEVLQLRMSNVELTGNYNIIHIDSE